MTPPLPGHPVQSPQPVLSGKRVAVIGAKRSGWDAARAMLQLGARVTLYDRADDALREVPPSMQEGVLSLVAGRDLPDWEELELIIVSPAVRPDHALFAEAQARGIPVWSEIELGYRLARAPIIAITGTNAKTTTTALIHHLLTHAGMRAHLCGNIAGTEQDQTLTAAALVAQPDEWIVAEVSSFQLQNVHQFRPHIAVITTITPDHLDWHGSFEAYARAKGRLLHNLLPTDWAVLNGADEGIQQLLRWLRADGCPGLQNVERAGHLLLDLPELPPLATHHSPLVVAHAPLAAQIAVQVARLLGYSEEQIQEGLVTFRGVPHRMELVAEFRGVRFINNSMCTNAAALEHSLRVVPKPCIVIAGGIDKNDSIDELAEAICRYCRAALLIGQDGERIGASLRAKGYTDWRYTHTLESAVKQAFEWASSGDTIILAPGCASFDMFTNFIERGERFRALVSALLEGEVPAEPKPLSARCRSHSRRDAEATLEAEPLGEPDSSGEIANR
ncbi:MAG: UDP-N-acetylmuramoyl-L-alanine--D-glutamate ligase [Fimbriimonadales bacterium]|nr:UDP-N-acetylmuramoyl-L-alanine--D-glutamate ligase [Fimbriimonadales bacterium]